MSIRFGFEIGYSICTRYDFKEPFNHDIDVIARLDRDSNTMKTNFASLFLCCLITIACESKIKSSQIDTHEVIAPFVRDMNYSSEYVAEIHSVRYVEIRSKIKGYIEKQYVDEGQAVGEGQSLFKIGHRELDKELQKASAAYKGAKADLQAAEIELNNVRRLVEKDIVSRTELDVMKARVESLQARLEEALANQEQVALKISFSQIKAPFHGFVNRIPHKVGSLIDEGDMLTSIADHREIFAYYHVSEIDYLNYVATREHNEKAVSLRLADNTIYGYEGKVEMIESEFDSATGNIAFRARFANPDGLLKHGSHGKVIVNKEIKDALFVPQKSAFEVQDKLYVYIIQPDGTLKQRNIVEKMRFSDYYVIESGLSKTERILYEGAEHMKDGDKIEPVMRDLSDLVLSSGGDSSTW